MTKHHASGVGRGQAFSIPSTASGFGSKTVSTVEEFHWNLQTQHLIFGVGAADGSAVGASVGALVGAAEGAAESNPPWNSSFSIETAALRAILVVNGE